MRVDLPRKTAVLILGKIENDGAYSNIVLKNKLSDESLSNIDKAFITNIVYGTLDRKITIDYIISNYVKTPVNKIKPITLNAIRIAIYQMRFMDKIPESAAVNESVNIVKASKEKYNASFVNGVLRSYLRNPVDLPTGNDEKSLGIRYSCSLWLIKILVSSYGLCVTEELLKQSLNKPEFSLRVNTLKTDTENLIHKLNKENVTAKKGAIENSVNILSSFDISNSLSFSDGLFHVEDLASQTVISKMNLTHDMSVLDICAAPGGKTFTMAQYLNNKGKIVANDLYENRVNLIKTGAKRLGINIIETSVGNSETIKFNESFDAVLCDVPCSGLGVIRRKPEIKYKDIKNEDLIRLYSTQKNILGNASSFVKKGGVLMYSTCTLNTAENEEQIKRFLDKHIDFAVQYEHTFMPQIDGTDGFYCALLVRNG